MSRINNDMTPALDYSQEARDLWGRLGEADMFVLIIFCDCDGLQG